MGSLSENSAAIRKVTGKLSLVGSQETLAILHWRDDTLRTKDKANI